MAARPGEGRAFAEIVAGAWDFEDINRRYARHLKALAEGPGGALRNDAASKALLRWAAAEREAWLDAVTNDPPLPGRILPSDHLGVRAWRLRNLESPSENLITVREADRSTEFRQRCDGLGINDVSLHCYRYGWAERSAEAGYPERYGQRVLGQNSKAVHRAYAKEARKQLPALEEYELASQQAEAEGKILIIEHEAEVPKVA